MKEYLKNVHNCFKGAYCDLISYETVSAGGNIIFNFPYEKPILIDPIEWKAQEMRSVTELQMVEGKCKVHCFFTDLETLEINKETWLPIEDFSMDELYEIAKRI